jgi:hypothetical protein
MPPLGEPVQLTDRVELTKHSNVGWKSHATGCKSIINVQLKVNRAIAGRCFISAVACIRPVPSSYRARLPLRQQWRPPFRGTIHAV